MFVTQNQMLAMFGGMFAAIGGMFASLVAVYKRKNSR